MGKDIVKMYLTSQCLLHRMFSTENFNTSLNQELLLIQDVNYVTVTRGAVQHNSFSHDSSLTTSSSTDI